MPTVSTLSNSISFKIDKGQLKGEFRNACLLFNNLTGLRKKYRARAISSNDFRPETNEEIQDFMYFHNTLLPQYEKFTRGSLQNVSRDFQIKYPEENINEIIANKAIRYIPHGYQNQFLAQVYPDQIPIEE